LVTAYVCDAMTEAERAAFDDRAEDDPAFFRRVAPILSLWFSKEESPHEISLGKVVSKERAARLAYRRPIARRAMMVTPRQPYYDWLATLGTDGKGELTFDASDASAWPRVLLGPSHYDEKSLDKFFDERAPALFELLLERV